jgi:hypothetical protein
MEFLARAEISGKEVQFCQNNNIFGIYSDLSCYLNLILCRIKEWRVALVIPLAVSIVSSFMLV